MPKKRRNNGRNKNHKGDIEEVSVYNEGDEKYQMPKLYIKNQYCVSCGIHARIVRVRSTVDRRIRYVSRYRKDQISEMSKGLYRVANQRKGDKPVINKEE